MSGVPARSKRQTLPDQITIEGCTYVKQGTASAAVTPQIGIAVTTHNRADVAARCIDNMLTNTPDAYIVVVDDASTEPFTADGVEIFRSDTQLGIARAKNKCIELLMAAGVEHLFLFDDDCWPTEPGWHKPYCDHPEPHLCYLFKDRNARGQILQTPRTTYDDGTMYALDHPRGCLLYMHRSVIDRVGGYRREFGIWGNEHVEYSRRIFNAGLTLQPFQDICGSDKLVYSLDADPRGHPNFARSVPEKVRREELARNDKTLERFQHTDDYVEYRDLPNKVITAMLTASIDPQRRKRWTAEPNLIDPWLKSISGADPVILADQFDGYGSIKVTTGTNPYVQRWIAYYQYLRDTLADLVFVTDAFDVTMLREPWPEMQRGLLYVGYEPTVIGIPWMRDKHPQHKDWIADNADRMLLNCGVIGGDRNTVMEFCHDMVGELLATESVLDMGPFNKLAYSDKWNSRIVAGPRVTSLFKHQETKKTNQWSWFAHK